MSLVASFDAVSVTKEGSRILSDISWDIDSSERWVIVGPNGAGKTTLMKAIAGLLVPDSGDVRLYGKDINGQTPAEMVQAGVTLVPEGRRLFGQLSVRENLMTGAYIRNDRAAIAADFETVLGLSLIHI